MYNQDYDIMHVVEKRFILALSDCIKDPCIQCKINNSEKMSKCLCDDKKKYKKFKKELKSLNELWDMREGFRNSISMGYQG